MTLVPFFASFYLLHGDKGIVVGEIHTCCEMSLIKLSYKIFLKKKNLKSHLWEKNLFRISLSLFIFAERFSQFQFYPFIYLYMYIYLSVLISSFTSILEKSRSLLTC